MGFPEHLRVLRHNQLLSSSIEHDLDATVARATAATRRADALLASLEELLPRSEWPKELAASKPAVDGSLPEVEVVAYEDLVRQTAHLGRVRVADVLDERDVHEIAERYRQCQHDFDVAHDMDGKDYLCASVSGIIAGVVDIVLTGGGTAALGKKLLSVLGAPEEDSPDAPKVSFDYTPRQGEGARGNHRSNSASHHVSLGGFIAAIRDVLNGTSTHVVGGELKSWVNVTKGVAKQMRDFHQGGGPVGVAIRVLQAAFVVLRHWWSDVNTPHGLPGPMMFLAKFFEVGSFSFAGEENLTLAELAHKLYGAGLDMRRFIGDSITVVVNEVLVRFLHMLRGLSDGMRLGEALRWAAGKSPRLRASLTVAHGITAAVNASKVILMENPLLINIPQWLAFGKLLVAHLWWSVVNRGAEEEAAHVEDWTRWMRIELAALHAIERRLNSMPVLGVG